MYIIGRLANLNRLNQRHPNIFNISNKDVHIKCKYYPTIKKGLISKISNIEVHYLSCSEAEIIFNKSKNKSYIFILKGDYDNILIKKFLLSGRNIVLHDKSLYYIEVKEDGVFVKDENFSNIYKKGSSNILKIKEKKKEYVSKSSPK